jgi:hypothetical protein
MELVKTTMKPEHKAEVVAAAERAGMTLAMFVRVTLLKEARAAQ